MADRWIWCDDAVQQFSRPRPGPLASPYSFVVWHTAGKITTTARRSTLHLDATWPWAAILQQGFQRLENLRFTT